MLLVIDHKETTVRYQAGTLRLERPEEKPQTVPIAMLEQVVVYGNPLVESGAWRALSEAGVPTVFLDVRGSQTSAFLGAGLATTLPLRRAQHRCAEDAAKQLELAAYVIEQKLCSYELPLRTLAADYALSETVLAGFRQQVTQTLEKLPTAGSINALSGLEGQVAAAWFALLAQALPAWNFNGRNRQPPRDPVNALLSLGYTLMLNEVRHALLSLGFDAALGFLHQDYPGREGLPLDLLETFRATIDHFVLRWLNTAPLDSSSFYYREEEGCRLGKSARPLLYAEWARLRQHCPRPFAPEDGQAWGYATITEITTGQAMRLRDKIKQLDGTG